MNEWIHSIVYMRNLTRVGLLKLLHETMNGNVGH